jgi:hypothetical protein
MRDKLQQALRGAVLPTPKLSIFLICLNVFCTQLSAQDPLGCKNATVVVNVFDSRNSRVTNLTAPNFKVQSRGMAAHVEASEFWHNPGGRVVVLLDMSGSMRGAKWKIAHAMALAFVSWAPRQEKISLLTFSDSVQPRFGLSDEKKEIVDWLSSSEVREGKSLSGRTALVKALVAGIMELSPSQPGDSIYIISDGGDNRGGGSASDIERELTDFGIRLFFFLIPDKYASASEKRIDTPAWEEVVRRSGGSFSKAENILIDKEMMAKMQEGTLNLQSQISDFYLLRIDGMEGHLKSKEWSIEVVNTDGHKRKDVTLSFPHRPAICREHSGTAQ